MVFHWGLSESKSSQVSRIFLAILADLNNIVVLRVSICPLISMSSSPLTNLLGIVPSASIIIGITTTSIFHSCFFCSLVRSRYLSLFSLYSNFTLWYTWKAKSTIRQVLFFIITRSGRLAEIMWSACISKSQRTSGISFYRTDFGLWIYYLFAWSTLNF